MRYLISEVVVDMIVSPDGGADVFPIPGRSGTMILNPRWTQISEMVSTVRIRLPGIPWKNNMTLSPCPYSAQEITRFPSPERIVRSEVVHFGYATEERSDFGGFWRFRVYVVYTSTETAAAAVKQAPTTTGRFNPMIKNKVSHIR